MTSEAEEEATNIIRSLKRLNLKRGVNWCYISSVYCSIIIDP